MRRGRELLSAALLTGRPPLTMRVVITCEAVPTQADVLFSDGRYGYFRYRHGRWSLELYARAPGPRELFPGRPAVSIGEDWREQRGELDGWLEDAELVVLLARAVPAALGLWDVEEALET